MISWNPLLGGPDRGPVGAAGPASATSSGGTSPRAAGRVDDREVEEAGGDGLVELELIGQLQQELQALVDDLGAARVGRGRSC